MACAGTALPPSWRATALDSPPGNIRAYLKHFTNLQPKYISLGGTEDQILGPLSSCSVLAEDKTARKAAASSSQSSPSNRKFPGSDAGEILVHTSY